jgi:enoyl-CoA hydratase
MGELLLDLYGGRVPVVAGCAGHAVAAGAMLLLASDRRIGAEGSYRVGFSEVSNGMPLPELPLLLARDRLDPRRLQESTLLGVLWEPAQAVEAGFLDFLVPARELEEEVSRQARELALLPAQAYSESIPSVRGATLTRMRDSMARERERLASLQREV